MAAPTPTRGSVPSAPTIIVNDTLGPNPLTDGQKRMLSQRLFRKRRYRLEYMKDGQPIRKTK